MQHILLSFIFLRDKMEMFIYLVFEFSLKNILSNK